MADHSQANWAQDIPQCTRCDGVAIMDVEGIVHHEGIMCKFEGSKNGWLDHLASMTQCPHCGDLPELKRPNKILHVNGKHDTFCGGSRGWLRRVEQMGAGDHPLTRISMHQEPA